MNNETTQEKNQSSRRQKILVAVFISVLFLIWWGSNNRAEAEALGYQCEVTVENQHSVHDWTMLQILEDGELVGQLKNVEREAFAVTTGTFEISNPDNLTFNVVPGPTGLSSLSTEGIACELTANELPEVEPTLRPINEIGDPAFLCDVTVANQFSVHAGTTVDVVSEGEVVGRLYDVEREEFAVTTATIGINDADDVTFEVAAGPSGLTSLDASTITCDVTIVEQPLVEDPEVIETVEEPTVEVSEEAVIETVEAPAVSVETAAPSIPVAQPAQAVVGNPVYAG